MAKSIRKSHIKSAVSNPAASPTVPPVVQRAPASVKTPVQNYNAMLYIKRDIIWSGICTLIIVILMIITYFVMVK